MQEGHELATLAVEDDHWWYVGRRKVVNAVLGSLDLPRPCRILDAGCGSGRNMVELARLGEVTGLEPSSTSLAAAEARGAGTVVQAPLESAPLPDASFDLAVCLDVLEHIRDDRAALEELHRLVRPGGHLLVTVPCYQWLWSHHDVVNQHHRRYSRTGLERVAAEAGWAVRRVTHFNSLLLPAAVALRLGERLRRSTTAPRSELQRTPGFANGALSIPLALEAALIGRGAALPAGLSLLAVLDRQSVAGPVRGGSAALAHSL